MSTASDRLNEAIERIRDAVGEHACLRAADDIEPYLVDFRRLYRGATPLVVRPQSTAEVAAVLAICNEARVGVVPQGGNTGYCGGATPSEQGNQIVLALQRMNRVRQIDPANYSMNVEAGCLLADVNAAAESADRLFPLSLGSEGSCQIGGNLSTNAGGLSALKYGVTRELVLGLEVVLPDGRIVDGLTSLRKDNTGYDLRDLFIGAEGTLGVITAASLKLFPRPRTVETAFAAVSNPQAAVDLLSQLRQASGDCVTSFEYLPRIAIDLTTAHIPGVSDPLDGVHDCYVLCELSSPRKESFLRESLEQSLSAGIKDGRVLDAAIAESLAQRASFWKLRESVPEAQRAAGASIKHDVSVPVAALPEFLAEAAAAVARIVPSGRLVAYGHVGDGNLHFNVSQPVNGDPTGFLACTMQIEDTVLGLVQKYRGSISAEHGIGRLKREKLLRYKSDVDLSVMRAIKDALDPRGIMNPGKVLEPLAGRE
jgi:FAD/FMN-containing dehydrogenase